MWSTVSGACGRALRKAVHGMGRPLQHQAVPPGRSALSPVGCKIEPGPIISKNARSAGRCSTCAIKPKCWRTTRRLKYARVPGRQGLLH
jgi:hypothetical protein